MSAEISNANGKDEMFFVGQKPWHGLGTELPALATAAQAIKAAGLDWKVEKRTIYFKGAGKMAGQMLSKDLEGRIYAVVRTDIERGLGTAGRDWTPLQNEDAFSFTDAIVQEKEAIYETAGALMGGRKVWILAKLKGVMRVNGSEDVLDRYLLLANSHENGHALHVKLTSVRVVCQNTLNEALGEKGQSYFKIRHSKNIGDKVADAREALGLINVRFEELQKKINRLAEVKVNASKFGVFAETIGYKPDSEEPRDVERFNALVKSFETSPGSNLASAKGTLWGAVNAVTYMVDHEKEYKKSGDLSAGDNKLRSIWWGGGNDMKSLAMDTALAMAK